MNQTLRRRAATGLCAIVMTAATALVGSTPASAQSGPPEVEPSSLAPIGHDGRWMTTADGRVLMLNGINFVDKNLFTPAGYGFDDDDGAWLAANGIDAVRLGLTAAAVMPTPGVIDEDYVDAFIETVDMLESHGLFVLIDLHQDGWGPSLGSNGFPEWMTLTNGAENTGTPFPLYYVTNPAIQAAFDSFWANEKGPDGIPIQDQIATIFTTLAQRLKGNDAILGWDLINEPWPGTDWVSCSEAGPGCPDQDASSLDPYYARMTEAIRSAGAEQLIFGEPWVLFNFGMPATNIALPGGDANSGLSFHAYTLDDANTPVVMDEAQAWSQRTGGALLGSEFGANPSPEFNDKIIAEFDRALVPWMYWAYNENTIGDLKAPPGDNEADAVDAIVRPHPLAVGGTPTRLHYDLAERVMRFTWDTARPDGSQSPADTETVFQVAPRTYPKGYKVLTVGATVTSEPNAASLTVVTDGSGAEPKVVVYPADAAPPSLDFPAEPVPTPPTEDEEPTPSAPGSAPSGPSGSAGPVAAPLTPVFTG